MAEIFRIFQKTPRCDWCKWRFKETVLVWKLETPAFQDTLGVVQIFPVILIQVTYFKNYIFLGWTAHNTRVEQWRCLDGIVHSKNCSKSSPEHVQQQNSRSCRTSSNIHWGGGLTRRNKELLFGSDWENTFYGQISIQSVRMLYTTIVVLGCRMLS